VAATQSGSSKSWSDFCQLTRATVQWPLDDRRSDNTFSTIQESRHAYTFAYTTTTSTSLVLQSCVFSVPVWPWRCRHVHSNVGWRLSTKRFDLFCKELKGGMVQYVAMCQIHGR